MKEIQKTGKMLELERKLGKSIDEIVEDILDSMHMLEVKASEEEARIRERLPLGFQIMIAISIVVLLIVYYGGVI